jgi:hypothetical protein
MLNQVLREIETAQAPITVRALSRKLGIEPDAMEGMIQFWVRKGRLQDDDAVSCNNQLRNCSTSCSGTADCAFIAKMPRTYSFPGQKALNKS